MAFGITYTAKRWDFRNLAWRAVVDNRLVSDIRGRTRCFKNRQTATDAAREAAVRLVWWRLEQSFRGIKDAIAMTEALPTELMAELCAANWKPSFQHKQASLPGGEVKPFIMVALDACEAIGIHENKAVELLDMLWAASPRRSRR